MEKFVRSLKPSKEMRWGPFVFKKNANGEGFWYEEEGHVEEGEKMMNGEGVKEEAKYEPHEEDVKKVIKVKKEMTKKAKSKTTRLKDENIKPVIKEEPSVKEESIMSNKTVAKGRRKTDKSEIKTGENVLGKTAQPVVPVKRVRRS